MLVIDGAYGEGGGQILRTSLTLAAVLSRPIQIKNIRAGRANPGLAAQHLAAVQAMAQICQARLQGDKLGSTELVFEPQALPVPGAYKFDVAEARPGGSAGAATLVLQTVLPALAMAPAPSSVRVKGGTHVLWSPSFHYFTDVYLPTAARLGLQARAELAAWGWYPAGGGEISVTIPGGATYARRLGAGEQSPGKSPSIQASVSWQKRGSIKQVAGLAVAANLPSHIPQRMADRAISMLRRQGLPVSIEPQRVRSPSPGAGIFLMAEYDLSRAGFTALGKKGKASEQVAEEAVERLLAFHKSEAPLDEHLTDQLILPMALSGQSGIWRTELISRHTLTNIWLVEHFLGPIATVNIDDNLIHFSAEDKQ